MKQLRFPNLFIQNNLSQDNIKMSEKLELMRHIANQIGGDTSLKIYYYLMTEDKKMYRINPFENPHPINILSNAYVYIKDSFCISDSHPASYYLPFLEGEYLILYAYLSKPGYAFYYSIPTPKLRYIAYAIRFLDYNLVVVEVADLDVVTNNLNLPRIVHDVLGTKQVKELTDEDIENIISELDSQRPFAGYDFIEAWRTINSYAETNDPSLVGDVYSIIEQYKKIITPAHGVYDIETDQFIEGYRNF